MAYQEAVDIAMEAKGKGKSAQDACQLLVKKAYEAGSQDNITCILIFIEWDSGVEKND